MTTLLIAFAASGALLIAISIPLILRKVPPNALYGLRVEATFADERVWYEANAATGRDFVIVGIVQLVLAVSLAVAGVSEDVYAIANIATLLVGVLTVAIVGIRRANRMVAR